ncbi:MAG: hypothetical protein ACI9MR_002181 [Myxococcota bacterium]|jgi:hypothetical protein
MMTLRNGPLALAITVLAATALATAGCGDDEGGFALGSEALLEFSPRSVNFPDVPRNGEARLNVTVRHIGKSGTIKLDPITLITDSPDLVIGMIEKTELIPGEVSRITIVYSSNNDPPDVGELVIGHNLIDNPETRIPIRSPGQRANLVASPGLLDFGVVQAAAPRTLDLTVLNGGTAPAILRDYEIVDDEDNDFSVSITPDTIVPPNGSAVVQVTYTPTGRDNDTAELTIFTEREDVRLNLFIEGEEETPQLVVEPSLLQLGWVLPNTVGAIDFVVRNDGNANLDIGSMGLIDAPGDVTLRFLGGSVSPLDGPTTLRPDETFSFSVIFTPREEVAQDGTPLAIIQVVSNDEARNPANVPVYGAAGEPSIVVFPSSIVDFAFVAETFEATRKVVVLNNGAGAVTVTSATLEEPSTDEFSFPDTDKLPATLNPGESLELELRFENRDGDEGTESARFVLETTDPLVPRYPLDVVARRAQRPTCEAAFVPDFLAMGAFAPNEQALGTLEVVNFGSGNCEFQRYDFEPCLQINQGLPNYFECDSQLVQNRFEIVSAPAGGTIIGPGESLVIDIIFEAPVPEAFLFGRSQYFAKLSLILFDQNSNTFEFVSPPGGWGRGVNISASSAIPLVEVDPPTIDFGLVRTDCDSNIKQVRVAATGAVDATVTGLEFINCPPGIAIAGDPTPPLAVAAFSSIFLDVTFSPDTIGDDACVLRISTDAYEDPIFDVQLAGSGTDVTHHIDNYLQIPPPKVDVLFVVDDSFSMGDDQQRLREELPAIVDIAIGFGQDYHLAVTTTDTLAKKGRLQGPPLFTTPADDVDQFARNLVVGTAGHFVERGLESAYLALFERNARTDIPCVNAPGQCPSNDGGGVPMICFEGMCGGINSGFLREDAQLIIIIVSDEEDGSERPVPFYVNRFANLKAPNSGVGVILHSIIVTPEGCLGGFGVPGRRYAQASEILGGAVASICADDFAVEFENIGNRTFGLTDRFYPSFPPDPATLEVRVAGSTCETGWTWNTLTNAIVFAEDSPCFPAFNETVELEYDVFCAAASE